MAMAISLQQFLDHKGIGFEVLHHKHSEHSLNTASSAHIPTQQLAKAVVLEDENHRQVMAVLPANRKLVVSAVGDMTYSHFHLVDESELADMFADCEPGVAPSDGGAYGLEMIVDRDLLAENTIYLEAGDHETLLKLDRENYQNLVMSFRDASIAGENLA